ncbi:hypothetical protein [Methylobacterium sp. Leaf91]|uniref:hypothetical protein n=1 Tax=Methylobacterium sp. Leaf91 TaxID=1736247 RepID=UPI00138EED4E|nr:hypothetical protein [Methylobacterium sp. Leaf91]
MPQTVIPAHEGFRVATFYFDGTITDTTLPVDLGVMYEPIIGWVVAPTFEHTEGSSIPEIVDSNVEPLLLDGKRQDGSFIVDPHGVWHAPYDRVIDSESEARRYWLSNARRRNGGTVGTAASEEKRS